LLKKGLKPIVLLTFINILGFALLYFTPSPCAYNTRFLYIGAILCAINIVVYCILNYGKLGDVYLFLLVTILVTIGVVMILRLDYKNPANPESGGENQILFYIGGLLIFFMTYIVTRFLKNLDKLVWLYVFLIVGLFLFTLIVGKRINGATNWIKIGPITLQPSEFIKILYILSLSCFMNNEYDELHYLHGKFLGIEKRDVAITAFTYMCIGFFVLQGELGTAVLFLMIHFTVVFMLRPSWRNILINLIIVAAAVFALVILVKMGKFSHIQNRITGWLNPYDDPFNAGYDMVRSLSAIASGGYFGVGLWEGLSVNIAAIKSDFIFAAICEELGIFAGVAIIMIYFLFAYRGVKIAITTKNDFYKTLAILTTVMFAYQTFIIVGGVIKLIPLTGITLPFVSAGGSSLLSSYISMGILVAISSMDKRRI